MLRPIASALVLSSACGLATAQKPTDVQRLATAVNTFARDVYGSVAAGSGPVVSPTSLGVALMMLLPGAGGDTANEIATVLHLPDDLRGDRLNAAVAELLESTELVGTKINAAVGVLPPVVLCDDIWVDRSASMRPEFVATLRRSFSAGVNDLDFVSDPDAARLTINAQIARRTGNRIRDLLSPGTIDAATRIVLTDALRLCEKWRHPFEVGDTTDAAFTLRDGTRVNVPTMRMTEDLGYGETRTAQVLSLGLQTLGIHCEIVLPKAGHDLTDAERVLFGSTYGKLTSERVEVALPRFQVRGVHHLAASLQALGMHTAFDPKHADFAAIGRVTPPLFVHDVVHEAWVKVDEQGIEAAAATAVVMDVGAKWPPDPPKAFHADRPFLFALRHRVTGLLLFVGRVDDPRRRD